MSQISIKNVWKEYGDVTVLERLDFEIQSGEFCVLVGPSGCGKTTFLRLLLSMEPITRGEILIDGVKIASEPTRDRGIVFQRYSVFPHLTVLGNAMLGVEFAEAKFGGHLFGGKRGRVRDAATEMLGRVGLGHVLNHYPAQLSGGMQQRLAIAQALLCQPKILLLDEAFGALDPPTKTQIHALMLELWKDRGMTVFMVTHDLDEGFSLGTRVIEFGKVRRDPQAPDAFGATLVRDVDLRGQTDRELRDSRAAWKHNTKSPSVVDLLHSRRN
ncbi:ABC transporter ATP-binding protein [Hyphomicrobium sp. 99]|uniref:ABC transporter ATP-binding protein n=1 Tax=Hyphomicrobium sp. 99 TaxID=1163419 RepID=UPI0005F7E4CE|nr:ABC transporter ATP-binding protein [Hyphomicrobium sp. 99]